MIRTYTWELILLKVRCHAVKEAGTSLSNKGKLHGGYIAGETLS